MCRGLSVSIQVWVRAPPVFRRSRQEGVFGGGLVHQSLHRHAHLHQAFLLQDVVRKTQFVLRGGETRGREGEEEAEEDLNTMLKYQECFCMYVFFTQSNAAKAAHSLSYTCSETLCYLIIYQL